MTTTTTTKGNKKKKRRRTPDQERNHELQEQENSLSGLLSFLNKKGLEVERKKERNRGRKETVENYGHLHEASVSHALPIRSFVVSVFLIFLFLSIFFLFYLINPPPHPHPQVGMH